MDVVTQSLLKDFLQSQKLNSSSQSEQFEAFVNYIVISDLLEFPLRNNGVTIVARKLQRVGPQFTLEDFQIVNGCQTSHVIAANAKQTNLTTMIPIKLVVTEDEDVTRQVIIASNQQNKVDQGSFWALDPIHKAIEIYFESKPGDQRLYYERRPGQFNTVPNIEKVRL